LNRSERRRQQKLARKNQQTSPGNGLDREMQKTLETAVAHHNAGELAQAEGLYRQVLEQDPDQPVALHLLGVVAHQNNQNEQAKTLISKAVALRPDYSEALFSLGNVLQALGRNELAVLRYRQVITQQPGHAAAHNNLATTLEKLGEPDAAAESLNAAIGIDPGQVDSYKNLGILLKKQNKPTAALPHFQKACDLEPGNADHHFNLGDTLHALDRIEQALPCFETVAALNPANASVHYRMGILYEKLHNLDQAEIHARRAFELAPDDLAVRYPLAVVLRRRGRIDEALAVLAPAGQVDPDNPLASSIHFELGTLYDRSHDSAKAFPHFSKCNALEAAKSTADKSRFLDKLELMARSVPSGGYQTPPDAAPASADSPVFIVGFPRSGTTLLDQILDAHPGLQVMEEQPAINAVIRACPGSYPAGLDSLSAAQIKDLRAVYFGFVDAHIQRNPNTRLVDKLPLNIVDIPLIVRLFPDARIILAMRHPCDVVLSNFMQLFILNDAMANFLTLDDAAHCYAQVMGLWQSYGQIPDLPWYMVRYESLISDLESEARALLDFLGLTWNPAVLDPAAHAKSRGRINTPSYQSVTEPLFQRAKFRWQRYPEQMAPLLDQLKPFVEDFGYDL